MNIKQVKALGAPFQSAKICVSLTGKIATLTVEPLGTDGISMHFRLDDYADDVHEVARSIAVAARKQGIINANSDVMVLDGDKVLPPVTHVPTQKIEIGGQNYTAACVIVIRNRDAVLTAMSMGEKPRTEVRCITFANPIGRGSLEMAIDEGLDLLAIVMPDGAAKYAVKPEHLPYAEEIALRLDAETLLRMPGPIHTVN